MGSWVEAAVKTRTKVVLLNKVLGSDAALPILVQSVHEDRN